MEFATLAVVGAFVSLLVQLLKGTFALSANQLRLAVIVMSFAAGTAYWFLQGTAIWEGFLSVLAIANTVFLFLIRPFEE